MQLQDLNQWIETQTPLFLQNLEALVNINTFTANRIGVDQGMDFLSQMAEGMGFQVEVVHGRHRLIKAGNKAGPRVLLIAHMDTVHPPNGSFLRYEPLGNGFVRGPGIGDIKGGLLMGLWTLLGISNLVNDFDVQLVVSADEEMGSPTIQDWYLGNAAQANWAIGLEPGFPQGELSMDVPMGVVQQRKGCGRVEFVVKGQAAHAGGAWEQGLSAIEAMAHRILAIQALTDLERGITTNVGLVDGGTAANTVPERARVVVDFRFLTRPDGEETLQAVQQIAETPRVTNPHLERQDQLDAYNINVYMPPMEHTEHNQHLVDIVLAEAERLNQNVLAIARGGGSDANYVSGGGVPAICGMGAPAQGIHTTEEKVLIPLMMQRLELLISTVYRIVTA